MTEKKPETAEEVAERLAKERQAQNPLYDKKPAKKAAK